MPEIVETTVIRPQTCPICRTELPPETGTESPFFPFCSERCKQIDLLRWADGRYAIVEPVSPDELPDPDEEGWDEDDADV